MIEKLKTWFRWRVAWFLDRFPDICWSDLVSWADIPELHPFNEIFEIRHTAGRCARLGEPPYCGKCAENDGK